MFTATCLVLVLVLVLAAKAAHLRHPSFYREEREPITAHCLLDFLHKSLERVIFLTNR